MTDSEPQTIQAAKDELFRLGWSAGDAKASTGYSVLAGKGRHVVEATGVTLLAAWLSALGQARRLAGAP